MIYSIDVRCKGDGYYGILVGKVNHVRYEEGQIGLLTDVCSNGGNDAIKIVLWIIV